MRGDRLGRRTALGEDAEQQVLGSQALMPETRRLVPAADRSSAVISTKASMYALSALPSRSARLSRLP